MNYGILLSGGTGVRIDSEVPKQYVRAGGHMMVTYALKPLLESEKVDAVYVVADYKWREYIVDDAGQAGIDTEKIKGFAVPGINRQSSILIGMQKIISDMGGSLDIGAVSGRDSVLIHDAARPFLQTSFLDSCYEALAGHDGVMPVLPVKDTMYISEDGKAPSELLERRKIFAGQAPELFLLKAYYKANMALMPDKIYNVNGSSEPAVMAGMDIVMIPGDENNFKVTTDADLVRYKQTGEEQM